MKVKITKNVDEKGICDISLYINNILVKDRIDTYFTLFSYLFSKIDEDIIIHMTAVGNIKMDFGDYYVIIRLNTYIYDTNIEYILQQIKDSYKFYKHLKNKIIENSNKIAEIELE